MREISMELALKRGAACLAGLITAIPAACVGSAGVVGEELPPLITNCEIRVNESLSGKKAFYYCDDVIWLFRDLTRQRPKSLFDNPFLKVMKEAHDKYGMKVQLNCFYRTDFFYGTDEFTLSEMTDAYRAEWQANKGWLRLGFHSLQEFPDYPFINADYKDMKRVLDLIGGEVSRFAGDGVFAKGAVVHWGTCSKEACRALRDAGFGIVLASCGPRKAYNGDPSVLPYGHAMRLEQNRKPETCLYSRISENEAISSSIGGYNNLTYAQAREIYGNFKYVYDHETGIGLKELEDFQPLAAGINLYTLEALLPAAERYMDNSFFVWGNHEQYFYRDYLAYQPEYAEKILAMAKRLKEKGYEHFFLEELVVGATDAPVRPDSVMATIETSLGTIELELDAAKAPLTVTNFMEYAKAGHYDGTVFHRVIDGFMIQGGGFTADMQQKPTRPPIRNEAASGLKNVRGTIAMARTQVVDSATSQFFINLKDNGFLDYRGPHPQTFGYAVFGHVTKGMDVVDKIAKVQTGNRGFFQDVPVESVVIKKVSVK